jgi:RimJ/RimL family protein N-acetyltransferase
VARVLESERLRVRAVSPDDAPEIFALRNDPELHLINNSGPFVPRSLATMRRSLEKADEAEAGNDVRLAVESRVDGQFVGVAAVWGIDAFNRYAHLGLTLTAPVRGRGLGVELLGLLCRYGFRLRNLRRLELETLADNVPMRRTAQRCGFVREGIQRRREYDGTGWADVALYGLLREEWDAAQ